MVAKATPVPAGSGQAARGAPRPGGRLRAQDAFFLDAEGPDWPQHSCAVVELEAPRPGAGLDPHEIADTFARRLEQAVGWSRLVVETDSFGRHSWMVEPSADVRARVEVHDAAGDPAVVETILAGRLDLPLDRSEPLWRADVVGNVGSGGAVLIVSLHHCLSDGQGALRSARAVMDEPAGPGGPGIARSSRLGGPWEIARGTAALARWGRAPRIAWAAASGGRDFAMVALAGAEVSAARKALGATSTELLLVLTADAVAAQLRNENRTVPEALRAMVALRGAGRAEEAGNWNAAVPVAVLVEGGLPLRLAALRDDLERASLGPEPAAATFVLRSVERAVPPPLRRRAARFAYSGKWFNFVVSIMAGPARIPHLAGGAVNGLYPLLPLAPGAPLSLSALAWGGRLCLGVTTAAGCLPAGEVASHIARALGDPRLG